MANDTLKIEEFRNRFKDEFLFGNQDIAEFYKQFETNVKPTTVNWRIYALVQTGVLQRIGRGKFKLGEGKNYLPEVSSKMKSIYNKVGREFPYLNICIWNTSSINEFMIHQPNRFYYLLEVEKEAVESVFYFLRNTKFAVFLEPKKDILEKYLPEEKEVIIVKSLVSEAPLLTVEKINTVSIEKMLVDIFCDDVIFSAQQGSEMRTIFESASAKYTVNQSKMLRYADRRGKKDGLIEFIKTLNDSGQKTSVRYQNSGNDKSERNINRMA